MAEKNIEITVDSPLETYSYNVYGSADGYISILQTVTDYVIDGTKVILKNVEVGTETIFKAATVISRNIGNKSNAFTIPTLTNKSLRFERTDLDRIYIELDIDTSSENLSYEFKGRLESTEDVGGGAFIGSHSSSGVNCYFGRSSGLWYAVFLSTGGSITGETFDLNTDYIFRMDYTFADATCRWYVDNILVKTLSGVISGNYTITFNIGKFSNTTLNLDGTWLINEFTFNGITFDFNQVVYNKVLGSDGIWYVVETLKTDMLNNLV